VGNKRAYFGNLLLWSHARHPVRAQDRGNPPQVGMGVDQDRAIVIPASVNETGGIDVTTYGEPHANLTQEAWIDLKDAMIDALAVRKPYAQPLVWCADDARNRVLDSGSGTSYVSTAAHGFAVGDRLFFVRRTETTTEAALHYYGWTKVTSTPSGTTFGVDVDPTTAHYTPTAGDALVVISSLWYPLCALRVDPITPQGGPKGDYYHGALVWRFVGVPTTRLSRIGASVNT